MTEKIKELASMYAFSSIDLAEIAKAIDEATDNFNEKNRLMKGAVEYAEQFLEEYCAASIVGTEVLVEVQTKNSSKEIWKGFVEKDEGVNVRINCGDITIITHVNNVIEVVDNCDD